MVAGFPFLATLWPQAIGSDTRLARPIQIAEYARNAPVVCADLSELTGVPITCDSFLKDDLIVLVVKHRPAAEVMAKVASTFDWEWMPQGKGYRLAPTDRFVYRARTGRAEILLAEGLKRQEAARALLSEIKTQDRRSLERRLEKLKEFVGPWTPLSDPGSPALREHDDIVQRLDRLTPLALAAFVELDPQALVRLYDKRMVLAAKPAPMQAPENEGLVNRAKSILERERTKPGDDPGDPRTAIPAIAHSVDIHLKSWEEGCLVPIDADGNPGPPHSVDLPTPPGSALLPKDYEKALSHERGQAIPPDIHAQDWDWLGVYASWMARVAAARGVDLISDAFDGYTSITWWYIGHDRFEKIRQMGFEPKESDGWLCNRIDRWPQYREEQVPRNILRNTPSQLNRGLNEPHFLSLDQAANTFSRLSVANLHSLLCPVDEKDYWFYCFWKELSDQSRADLFAGRSIPISRLPGSALQFLFTAGESPVFVDLPKQMCAFGPFAEPDFFDEVGWWHRFNEAQFNGQVASDFASVYPARLDRSAGLRLQQVTIPGLYSELYGKTYLPIDLMREPLNSEPPTLVRAGKLRLADVKAMRFHFTLADGQEVQEDITDARLMGDVSANPSTWPRELIERIEAHKAIEAKIYGRHMTPMKPK